MQLQEGKEQLIRLRNGPIDDSRRSCTDITCLIIFALMALILAVITFSVYSKANVSLITQGYDADGQACGLDTAVLDYPYIYFASTTALTKTVCVKSCPKVTTSASKKWHSRHEQATPLFCQPNSQITSCSQAQIYNSAIFDDRVCIPTDTATFASVFQGLGMGFSQQFFDDISQAKGYIFLFVLVALGVTILNTYLLKHCSAALVWFILMLIVLLSLFFSYYSYVQYKQALLAVGVTSSGYLLTSLFCLAFAVTMIVLMICYFRRIGLAIALMRSAADFVGGNMRIILIPVFYFLILIVLVFLLFWIAILIYSTGTMDQQKNELPFRALSLGLQQKASLIFLLSYSLWILSSLIASNNFIIAGVVCIWYWQQGRSGQESVRPVRTSIGRLFKFHLGTAFFGAFLLGLVSPFRFLFEILYTNAERMKNSTNFSFCFKCCACCIWCFERFLQFLNQNIYVQTNMTGDGLLISAQNSLEIMSTSPLVSVTGLGDLLNNLSRIFICLLTSVSFYEFISVHGGVVDSYNPTIVVALTSFMIASVFTSVYGVAIESILHLFCLDEEIAKATNNTNGAEMCPASLKEFLNHELFNQKI